MLFQLLLFAVVAIGVFMIVHKLKVEQGRPGLVGGKKLFEMIDQICGTNFTPVLRQQPLPTASNSGDQALPETVKFSVDWNIPWSVFGTISFTESIEKIFVTSYNKLSLRWRIGLERRITDQPKNGFYLYYEDGPLANFFCMNCTVAVVKPDLTTSHEMTQANYEVARSPHSLHVGWPRFVDRGSAAVRQKYGLQESDTLTYRIVLKIPASVFSYKFENPLPTSTPPPWLVRLFDVINDPQRSIFSNATLISRDGDPFYCHKVISFQSTALEAMFRHPPGKNQAENEYPFPGLGTDSLKSLIKYLYTGQAVLGSLSTADLIDLADGAEQYDLKPLKQACASVLWDRVAEDPSACYPVVRFANLHDDMKYLKYRAMDVLAESPEMVEVSCFGEGNEGKKLLNEFLLFTCRRVGSIWE